VSDNVYIAYISAGFAEFSLGGLTTVAP